MVAVQFIGSLVPRRFAIALSVIYTLFCALPGIAIYGALAFTRQLGDPTIPDLTLFPVLVMTAAWIVSLWYMFHVRSTGNDS